jgi:hypothetical protein
MALMAYLSYMLAEVNIYNYDKMPFNSIYVVYSLLENCELLTYDSSIVQLLQLSGILAVFFCGIVMSHYAWHNVTENSRITTRCMPPLDLCLFFFRFQLEGEESDENNIFVGIYLRHCPSLLRLSFFFMLEWMHLTLINGKKLKQGIWFVLLSYEILFLLYEWTLYFIIFLFPFLVSFTILID